MLEHITNKKVFVHPRDCLGVRMIALYWVGSKSIVFSNVGPIMTVMTIAQHSINEDYRTGAYGYVGDCQLGLFAISFLLV